MTIEEIKYLYSSRFIRRESFDYLFRSIQNQRLYADQFGTEYVRENSSKEALIIEDTYNKISKLYMCEIE